MNDLIASNKRRTVFLIFSFVVILVAVGSAAGLVLGNPVIGTVFAFSTSPSRVLFAQRAVGGY